ncbi:calcium:proton antiporter [Alienimonas californiensis]|uniref:Cation exchanger YfkE n=1 Tax=Alienimonas californiensis TaxID=2527989 RepID=A0A517P611_9PLAN|nr:cation transporter [Alienimonas californiensis]QDT14819.1 Putative cation exchanger YfkE [Alienimonas californiensis]
MAKSAPPPAAPAPKKKPVVPHRTRPFWKTLPKIAALLALGLPAVLFLQFSGVGDDAPGWLFVAAALAILGTVTLIGKATEEVALYAGPLWGGLLNATFGNVTELIIAVFALSEGPKLYPVVRASITGSILGNLLLVLGAAMVYGGTKYTTQKFSRTGAHANVGMLWVTVLILSVPALVHLVAELPGLDPTLVPAAEELVEAGAGEEGPSRVERLAEAKTIAAEYTDEVTLAGAGILLGLYVLMLIFSLRTHRFLLRSDEAEHEAPEWSVKTAAAVLLGATLCVAYLSEAFVHAIDLFRESGTLDISELFLGVVVVAVVGNAAEGLVAVWVARENKMELSFQIAMGSSLQVALLVAPVLVFASGFMNGWGPGELMTLEFSLFELLSLAAAVLVAGNALSDGESNWLEGAMFLAMYVFFALVFWFHP